MGVSDPLPIPVLQSLHRRFLPVLPFFPALLLTAGAAPQVQLCLPVQREQWLQYRLAWLSEILKVFQFEFPVLPPPSRRLL